MVSWKTGLSIAGPSICCLVSYFLIVFLKRSDFDFDHQENKVEKRHDLTPEEFYDKYDGKRPVILTNVVPTWPAAQWSIQYLAEQYTDDLVTVQMVKGTQIESAMVPLGRAISALNNSSPSEWSYVQDELFLLIHPDLRSQILETEYTHPDWFTLLPPEVRPWDCMLLLGGAHSRSSLHIDPYNWTGTNAVIFGRKTWKLIPAGQDVFLSVKQNQKCGFPLDCFKYNSAIDAFNPTVAQQALLDQVIMLEVTQGPGEMMIIPTGWWHQAYNLEPTLAISGQVMNINNYQTVLDEVLKGGSISRDDLPTYFDMLTPEEQIKAVMKRLPNEVLKMGAKINNDALMQRSLEGS